MDGIGVFKDGQDDQREIRKYLMNRKLQNFDTVLDEINLELSEFDGRSANDF